MNYNPLLSIATATLEVGAAVWALRGPGRKPIIHAVSSVLIFLAAYQIIEAIFCTGSQVTLAFLPKLAFMVVAWLPPTGLLLVARLYPTKTRTLHYYSYAMYIFCGVLVAGIVLDKSFCDRHGMRDRFCPLHQPDPALPDLRHLLPNRIDQHAAHPCLRCNHMQG